MQPKYHSPEEEIALATGAYLWDYLRRSGTAGYLVPLSGGIDSCATATIVFSMCRLVIQAIEDGNQQVIEDVKRLAKYRAEIPETPQELCNQIFHTIYMGMSKQSSKETRGRAKELSEAIGSFHVNLDIDEVYNAQKNLIINSLNFDPKFKVEGGSNVSVISLEQYAPFRRYSIVVLSSLHKSRKNIPDHSLDIPKLHANPKISMHRLKT